MLADIFISTQLGDFSTPKTIYHNLPLWEHVRCLYSAPIMFPQQSL